MSELKETDPGFAPADPTDDRAVGEWKTRYEPQALRQIRIESIYLAAHLFGTVITVFLIAVFRGSEARLAQSSDTQFGWEHLLHAWLGGVLGGSVFAIKWLVHCVAKDLWNLDRRLWRLFTPHVSGVLAFAFIVLMASGFIVIIDSKAVTSVWVCLGLGFLIGYFSDNATAKLSEVAKTLFGSTKGPNLSNTQQSDDDGES